jgi:hypothetical protein
VPFIEKDTSYRGRKMAVFPAEVESAQSIAKTTYSRDGESNEILPSRLVCNSDCTWSNMGTNYWANLRQDALDR